MYIYIYIYVCVALSILHVFISSYIMLYLDMFMAMFIFKLSTSMFRPVEDTARWSGLVATRKVPTPAPAAPALVFSLKNPRDDDGKIWEDWGEVIGDGFIYVY